MRRHTITLLVVGALVASACAATDSSGDTSPRSTTTTTVETTTTTTTTTGTVAYPHGTASTDLVLRIESGGGFLPVELVFAGHPEFSLMGDGSVITGAPQIAVFPPPALPALQIRGVDETGIQEILGEAERAGLLDGGTHHDFPCVADAATTTFTVTVDGVTSVTSVYALGIEGGRLQAEESLDGELSAPTEEATVDDSMRCGLSDEDLAARAVLAEFSAKLAGLEAWLPAGSVGPAEGYEPSQMRVFVSPYRANGELPQEPVVWPLATPLDAFGQPTPLGSEVRCGVLEGSDLEQVVTIAAPTNTITPWASNDTEWSLVFRALLPDESGCPTDG